MIGQENSLPAGYQGYVFHRPSGTDEDGDGGHYMASQKTRLTNLGSFDKTTEWRKD